MREKRREEEKIKIKKEQKVDQRKGTYHFLVSYIISRTMTMTMTVLV